ncbi:hypothetical protein PFISCL1PPCAC_2322 [Pristionchus fissidentatus]|uniref:G protein-coupled receptor n=1 Tax=Pristionchus fissidentatus TaxID=1538716 RepID=A0AAV5UZP4_9BILA|nr:hypothetical protein PFISCL1PPCAC_2322 [Pristionchus fissidentatus]
MISSPLSWLVDVTGLAFSQLARFVVYSIGMAIDFHSLLSHELDEGYMKTPGNSTVDIFRFIERGSNVSLVSVSWLISLVYLIMLMRIQSTHTKLAMLQDITLDMSILYCLTKNRSALLNTFGDKFDGVVEWSRNTWKNASERVKKKWIDLVYTKPMNLIRNYMAMGVSVSKLVVIYTFLMPLLYFAHEYLPAKACGNTEYTFWKKPSFKFGVQLGASIVFCYDYITNDDVAGYYILITMTFFKFISTCCDSFSRVTLWTELIEMTMNASALGGFCYDEMYGNDSLKLRLVAGLTSIYSIRIFFDVILNLLIVHTLYTFFCITYYDQEPIVSKTEKIVKAKKDV